LTVRVSAWKLKNLLVAVTASVIGKMFSQVESSSRVILVAAALSMASKAD
jgi:hypothetical protein